MKKTLLTILVLVLLATVFTSCSTTIPVVLERPAELDLNGADTIAVLPIQVNEGGYYKRGGVVGSIINFFSSVWISDDEVAITSFIKNGLDGALANSQYITLVNSDSVQRALNNGTEIPCDVYFAGTISNFKNDIKDTKEKRYDENYEEYTAWVYYRTVSFDFSYQIIDSTTNSIISLKNVSVSAKSDTYTDDEWDEFPDTLDTIRYELNSLINTIMKQLQPYTETKYITLAKDKTKDPDMKTADALVKKGLIDSARDMYADIYARRGYFEAGYNAAIILEAKGDYETALEEMQALVKKFGDSRAIDALSDIQREIDSRDALAEQLAK